MKNIMTATEARELYNALNSPDTIKARNALKIQKALEGVNEDINVAIKDGHDTLTVFCQSDEAEIMEKALSNLGYKILSKTMGAVKIGW